MGIGSEVIINGSLTRVFDMLWGGEIRLTDCQGNDVVYVCYHIKKLSNTGYLDVFDPGVNILFQYVHLL
jgi:hypothetical protein